MNASPRRATAGAPNPRAADAFAQRLLAWFDRHGRHDLPWQIQASPYRVWISEVMLQQTRVPTVLRYFPRFVHRFPSPRALAGAPLDEVLHLWSGLGYYARARNLHRAARAICREHAGELPDSREALEALPGIGRSTAGAILALARGQRHAILDGNVKRVLARYHALEGWPGKSAVLARLWTLADAHTPHQRVAAYTQAIMDLGATVCVRTRPLCGACPVAEGCRAYAEGRTAELPAPRPKPKLPERATAFLILRDARGRVLLERRPPSGVWGGLWSFPECAPDADVATRCTDLLGRPPGRVERLAPLRHTFTHFHLDIEPLLLHVEAREDRVLEGDRWLWYKADSPERLGLAAPVSRLLRALGHDRLEPNEP